MLKPSLESLDMPMASGSMGLPSWELSELEPLSRLYSFASVS